MNVLANLVGEDYALKAVYVYEQDEFGPDSKYFILVSPGVSNHVYGFVTTEARILTSNFGCAWQLEDFVLLYGLGPPLIEFPQN